MGEIATTEEAPDKGKEPINPHEEFRRAKRNVLLWSGLAGLIAFSMPDNPRAHVLFGLARLELPAWLLLVSLAAVVAFMFAGYLRQHRFLRVRHSETLFETKAGEAIDALDQVSAIANDARVSLLAATGHVSELHSRVEKWRDKVKKRLSAMPIRAKAFEDRLKEIEREFEIDLMNGMQRPNVERIAWAEKKSHHWMAEMHKEASMQRDNLLKEPAEIASEVQLLLKEEVPADFIGTDVIEGNFKRIGQLSTNIGQFHKSIANADKLWHFTHDVLPVSLVTHFAIMTILLRAAVFVEHRFDPEPPPLAAVVTTEV